MDYEAKPFMTPEQVTFMTPEQVTLPPARRPNTQAMTPHIKMFVSDWYTDELGNKARVIKARD
jgi:hypothetical protein